MHEYRFLKAWRDWDVGGKLFPNCSISGGELRWLVANGYLVLASEYKPPESAKATASRTITTIETAAYESPPLRRRPGRPRKYDSNGQLIAESRSNGDSGDLNEEAHV